MLAFGKWFIAVALFLSWPLPNSADDATDASSTPRTPASIISFSGNRAFSDTQLAASLDRDLEFLKASHRVSDQREFCKTVQSRLALGYRHAGFPDVQVNCQSDEGGDRWSASISEGARFQCGKIRVLGAKRINEAELIERLTRPQPDADSFPSFVNINGKSVTRWIDEKGKKTKLKDPVWQVGKPISFESDRRFHARCRETISDLGFSQAFIFVTLDRNSETQTVDLVIDIAQEGAKDQISEVIIEGLNRHSHESLLDYVQIRQGDFVDRLRIQQVARLLWESGRFKSQWVQFDAAAGSKLRIRLEEIEGVPTLDQPLSTQAEILLRAGEWVSQASHSGDDVKMTYFGTEYHASLIQSVNGFYFELCRANDETQAEASPRANGGANVEATAGEKLRVLVDASQILIDHSRHPDQLSFSPIASGGYVAFGVNQGAAAEPERYLSTRFEVSLGSKLGEDESPLQYACSNRPAHWLPLAYKAASEFRMIGNCLEIVHKDHVFEIEIDSGRIKQWRSSRSSSEFVAGAFAKAKRDFLQDVARKPNAFEASQPATSIARYLLSRNISDSLTDANTADSWSTITINPKRIAAIRKLVDGGLLCLIDAFISAEQERVPVSSFVIPYQNQQTTSTQWSADLGRFVGRMLLRYAPDLCEEGTWPMQMMRLVGFNATRSKEQTKAILTEIYRDPQNGPLCHACVATLLAHLNSDAAAKIFAKQAIEKLSAEEFERDYQSLLASAGASNVHRMLTCMSELTEEEFSELTTIVQDDSAKRLMRVLYDYSQVASGNEAKHRYTLSEGLLRRHVETILR